MGKTEAVCGRLEQAPARWVWHANSASIVKQGKMREKNEMGQETSRETEKEAVVRTNAEVQPSTIKKEAGSEAKFKGREEKQDWNVVWRDGNCKPSQITLIYNEQINMTTCQRAEWRIGKALNRTEKRRLEGERGGEKTGDVYIMSSYLQCGMHLSWVFMHIHETSQFTSKLQ